MESNSTGECPVTLNLPYPPVQPESCRPEYAYAMLSNVGSDNSEMSAVCLYFYNSVLLTQEFPNFAGLFHQISIVEMHHLDIFASFAFQMGLDPRLWSMKNRHMSYWTPAYNRYPRIIRMVIENSIRGEIATIDKYTRQAESIKDANIVENLNRIILDEQHHIKLFQTMLEQIT